MSDASKPPWGLIAVSAAAIVVAGATWIALHDRCVVPVLAIVLTPFTVLLGIVSLQMSNISSERLYPGTWRQAEAHGRILRAFTMRYMAALYINIVVVGLLVASAIVGSEGFARASISLAVGAFVPTVALPVSIARHQLRRIRIAVKERIDHDIESLQTERRQGLQSE